MSSDPSSRKQPLLLVVDDDDGQRMLARASLEQAGFSVEEAATGEAALDQLGDLEVSLILLDVEMPGIDGFETCSRIRDRTNGEHIPVLMMTGHDDAQSIHRAYEVGATDFITKPINWLLLAHRVLYILRASRNLEALRRSEERLENAQSIAKLGNWEWTIADRTFECSSVIQEVFGLDRLERPLTSEKLASLIHPDDRERVQELALQNMMSVEPFKTDYRIVGPDGTERFIETDAHLVLDEHGEPIRLEGTSQDITRRRQAEDEVRHLAYHDSLTGLANRYMLRELLSKALTGARRANQPFALLYVDLDNFKRINDTLGHAAGDVLLQSVADRLQESVRNVDWVARPGRKSSSLEAVARLGGDEFAVILTNLDDVQSASTVARRVLENLAEPILLQGHELTACASIGITVWPDDGGDEDVLLRNADTAMYAAKEQGKNSYRFYAKEMNIEAMKRLSLENSLRKAIRDDELLVYYQPKYDAKSGRLTGLEALLRWDHPEMGVITPGDFIYLAEETGLITQMGEWALRAACVQLREWLDEGLEPGRLAVNFSAQQFKDPDLLEKIDRALGEAELSGRNLEVEITETTLMGNVKVAAELLARLRADDITVAIDDFGTGYSSLRYLRQFPVNTLKIDRSFVSDVTSETEAAEIICAIVSMAKALRLTVVAEGVESKEQWSMLRSLGCDEIQGFVMSRPLDAQSTRELLAGEIVRHANATA